MLTRGRIAWALAFWWMPQPVAAWWFYHLELELGAYPIDADGIGIPILLFIAGWLVWTPLIVWLVWWIATRGSRGPLSWLAFDRAHAIWCGLWSLLLVVAALVQIRSTWASLRDGFISDVVFSLLGAVVLLAARAALCTPPQAPAPESVAKAAP
jgi:hypothetical protein